MVPAVLVNGAAPVERGCVERQLDRILSSSGFQKSEQLCRFLRYTVEQALHGGRDGPKEYLIGLEIFGRRPDYDPRTDPIVRVEARRLRRKLEEYYEREGRADPVLIHVPKGGYLPVFEPRKPAEMPRPNGCRALAVLPFVDRTAERDLEPLCDGLTERLMYRLAAIDGVRVVAATSVFRFKNRSGDVRRIAEALSAQLVVEGSVRRASERVRIAARLVAAADGLHLWAGSWERHANDAFTLEDELAELIAQGVANTTLGECAILD